jgi:hypothetical protein
MTPEFREIKSQEDWYEYVDSCRFKMEFRSGTFHKYSEKKAFKELYCFFNDFMADPPEDKKVTIDSPIGKIGRNQVLIDAERVFCKPEQFARQGDLIKLKSPFLVDGVKIDNCIIKSHTCDIDPNVSKKPFLSVFPALTKEEFVSIYTTHHARPEEYYSLAQNNQLMHFVYYQTSFLLNCDYIIDLQQGFTTLINNISRIRVSLTLAGHFYFQNRMVLPFLRDIERRDDLRILISD